MRVAIVGGGPAGALAAIRLARAGAPVTLFDHSHPREKPCGGGLTGRALALLRDAIDISALPAVVVRSATIEPPRAADGAGARWNAALGAAGAKPGAAPHPGTASSARVELIDCGLTADSSLVVSSRADFDGALIDAAVRAGARLIREKAVDVSRRGATTVIRTARQDYVSDVVIGADGANSVVRKRFARPFSRAELSVAAGYYVHGLQSDEIIIQSMTAQPGYLWSFPRPNHLAVGICAPAAGRTSSIDLKAQSLEWIVARGLNNNARLEAYAWPIPSAGSAPADEMCTSGPGWLLLGDAAGLVDPLTREGIYYALLSGVWAADALGGRFSLAHDRFRERLIDEVYPELHKAAILSRPFFSSTFAALLVTALRQSASIRAVFGDLVAGTQPYRGLRRRLLRTGEWRLAGRALQLVVQ